jgi:hypothetical protein
MGPATLILENLAAFGMAFTKAPTRLCAMFATHLMATGGQYTGALT